MSKSRAQLLSVDLFAGCGGLSLGLRQAGFETLAYSEINADASATFELNLGGQGVTALGDITKCGDSALEAKVFKWYDRARGVDLLSGGPPCQGYSGIGHRRSYAVEKEEIPSNYLFLQMIRAIRVLKPKIFLFENVRGLISGRWTADGDRGEIWKDVRSKFRSLKEYDTGWKLVQAKDYGIPQNRPRILLVGARREVFGKLEVEDVDDAYENPRGLIPEGRATAPHLMDVLSDLDDPAFAEHGRNDTYLKSPLTPFQHEIRKRALNARRELERGAPLTEQEYSQHSARITEKFQYMLDSGGRIHSSMKTKKFAQRLLPAKWGPGGPTITATSLPDDFVHYARPRILTVREWARLQLFPDWFKFCGPRTTGGLRRAGNPSVGLWEREVPKYTQIGNAVPVGLARALGKHLGGMILRA